MNWLAKLIAGEADEFVHSKLVKYGLGEYVGPRVKLTISSKKIGFKADLDLEKPFIRGYLAGAPEGSHKVAGLIMSYEDRRDEFTALQMPLVWKVSKGKGATTYKSKLKEIAPLPDIKELFTLDNPTTFYLLTLSPRDGTKPWKVTTKTSFPKGPKGGDDDKEEKDPVFVKGALENTPEMMTFIKEEILPDFQDKIGPKTKKIYIHNTLVIEDIEIPDDDSLSFKEKRKLAKKVGKLVRTVEIDGETHESEISFKA
jgi:hypothetical protein